MSAVVWMATDVYQEEDYKKRLESLMHLAELCIELLKQNDEHYADVSHLSYSIVVLAAAVAAAIVRYNTVQ